MITAMLVLILLDICVTVLFARRAEVAAKEAATLSEQIMQGLLDQADHEPMARRRHL